MDKLDNFSEMSNNEILMFIKDLQMKHEGIKLDIERRWDELRTKWAEMERIEQQFKDGNDYLTKRIKG
jgi:hypothetical protein